MVACTELPEETEESEEASPPQDTRIRQERGRRRGCNRFFMID